MIQKMLLVLLLITMAGMVAACSLPPAAPAVGVGGFPPTATRTVERATAVVTPTPTATDLPPTSTPSPTLTPSITPTPTPTHPMMIEVMRQGEYPGSEIVFEETLEPGANYDRYIISYQSEGNKIYALFTVPWGEVPASGWPVIIFNHGYIPPEVYRTTERYVDYVDVIARNGYIVLKSDYRGHGESEGESASSYRSPGYTVDVLNALASARRYPNADPDRIGMWGHSMGGNITLRAMVISGEIKAGVIWGGVVVSYPDMVDLWWSAREENGWPTPEPGSERGRWRTDWEETYGTFEENPDFWASISANAYLSDLSGPVQLHHGTADDSVPHVLSEVLAQEITAVGLPVELYLYEGDNHNISINFWTAMTQTVEFFDLWVKGEAAE